MDISSSEKMKIRSRSRGDKADDTFATPHLQDLGSLTLYEHRYVCLFVSARALNSFNSAIAIRSVKDIDMQVPFSLILKDIC